MFWFFSEFVEYFSRIISNIPTNDTTSHFLLIFDADKVNEVYSGVPILTFSLENSKLRAKKRKQFILGDVNIPLFLRDKFFF